MTRRTCISLAALSLATRSLRAAATPFTLAPLPYAVDALEPFIDAQTMQLHHDKHHQAYVDNLNKALAAEPSFAWPASTDQGLAELLSNLDRVPASIRTQVRNHGGGHSNHTLFWNSLTRAAKQKAPSGKLATAINATFGSREKLEDALKTTATGVFGSGWAWLSLDKTNKLILHSLPNQDSPLSAGNRPVLGIDVWEHAYYLKYQNRRPEYLAAILKVIDWDAVSARFEDLSR